MPNDKLFNSNPALSDLDILIGNWEMRLSNASFLPDPSTTFKGNVSSEWLEDGAFLIMRMGEKVSQAPSAVWLIHRDDAISDYKVFYYDDRKVSRIYDMSFSNKVWKMWRQSPGFSQRFEGNIADHGNKILAHWEKSDDGHTWEHDFDITYSRLKLR